MNGLEQQFSGPIAFFHLNFDEPADRAAAVDLGVARRSTYLLLDGDNRVLRTWIGPLNSADVSAGLTDAVAAAP